MATTIPAETLKWRVIGVVGVLAMTALVVWFGIRGTVGAVVPEVTGYKVLSDAEIRVEYRLVRPADRAVTCVITALDHRKGRVGTVTDEIPGGATRVQRTVTVRTTERAVTGVVDSCTRL